MNPKTVIPLIIALALGGLALKLGKDMMDKRQGGGPGVKMARIVLAARDLAPGTVLKETDFATGKLPAESLPPGTLTAPAELAGRVVSSQMMKGQPVFEALLAPRGTGGGAQAIIPEGMRAVSLEVNEFSGVAGLLVPGCRVDVVQTLRLKNDEQMMARTIVENLKVIAIGRRLSSVPPPGAPDADPAARSVTVLATQEQAEILDLAAHLGSPRLVLRNGQDQASASGRGVNVAELRGLKEQQNQELAMQVFNRMFAASPAVPPPPRKPVNTPPAKPAPEKIVREVEVIRGGAASSVKFQVASPAALTGAADRLESAVPGNP